MGSRATKPAEFIETMPLVDFQCVVADVATTKEFAHLFNEGAKALSRKEKAKLYNALMENHVPLVGMTDKELTEICSVITARSVALN